jgi:uncharacterized membrane-anchored protein YhcB (DUF1043 family)
MADMNWVQIGVGFIVGVFASYLVCDLVFPIRKHDE